MLRVIFCLARILLCPIVNMARIARIVVPNYPHHVIQRGNRCQTVFFNEEDKQFYLELLDKHSKNYGILIWAYCLMDNHVHLIVVPEEGHCLANGIGRIHEKYTRKINFRENWRGYLWQGRFLSYPMEEKHLYAAVRYVERNPVRSGLVDHAVDYPWSSARAHILGEKNTILSPGNFLVDEIEDWENYLAGEENLKIRKKLHLHANTGYPLGSQGFLNKVEEITGRTLRKKN